MKEEENKTTGPAENQPIWVWNFNWIASPPLMKHVMQWWLFSLHPRPDLFVVVLIDPKICGHVFEDRVFRNENNRGIKENTSMMNFYGWRMCILGIKMKINEEELKWLMFFFSVSIWEIYSECRSWLLKWFLNN